MPEARNKRFMLVKETIWFLTAGKWLREKFGNKYRVAHRHLPKFFMYMGTFFDPEIAFYYTLWGSFKTYDNEDCKKILGIEFTDLKESL